MSRRLINAAADGNLELVELYIFDYCEGILCDCEEGMCEAAKRGHTNIIKFFYEEGYSMDINDESPLFYAAINERFDTVKFLLDIGANKTYIENSIYISHQMKNFIKK